MMHLWNGMAAGAVSRRFAMGAAVAMIGASVGGGTPAWSQSLRANLNHEMTGTVVDRAVQRLAAAARERSNGRIAVTVHSRGEMGGERAMFDLMQAGAIEMGVSGSVIVSAIAPEYGVLDAPYLIGSPEHLARVIGGPVGESLRRDILQRKGIRIIGHMDRAPRHLTTRGRAVRTPADLRGLKVRIREIPVQVQAFRLLGASPVPMAFGEVYTALQTRVLDAQENPLDIILGASFNEVQDHVILTGHVREVQWLIVSDRWWNSLSPADRTILQAVADEAMAWGQTEVYAADARLVADARAKGMTIVELTADERAAFQRGVADLPRQFERIWKPGLFETIVAATPR